MWRSISLRNRLNLIFGSLLALWLCMDVGRTLIEASGRARAETQNAMRLTKDLVTTTLGHLQDAPEPARAIEALLASLQNVRHVRVGVGEPSFASAIVLAASNSSQTPRWFRALVNARTEVAAVPVVFNGRRMNSIVIVSDPSAVIDEAWTSARDEALAGAMLALAAISATGLLVGRALKPLGVAGVTLARLESGEYAARAEGGGPPEIRDLNAKVNSLAGALESLSRANGELIERVFAAHDEERRLIANELHDEFGPHLFALRASAAVLAAKLGEAPTAHAAAVAIQTQVEALQGQNRRILAHLRPAALEELGLVAALRSLVAHWRRAEPEVDLTLDAHPRTERLSDRASLMIYRFVQEALTNAFRHAEARRIAVTLTFYELGPEANSRNPELAGLVVRVADDGRGPQGEFGAGMGLAAMRDRVRAFAGRVDLFALAEGGAVIEARFGAALAACNREEH
jgi:two-component system, NarL family, sensor histidine kinase UhpB